MKEGTSDIWVQAYLERAKELDLDVVNMKNKKTQTPLYLAVCTNKHLIVRVLLKFGASVNSLVEVCGSFFIKQSTVI